MRIAFGDFIQNTVSEKKAENIAYSKKWPDLTKGTESGPVAICAAGPSLIFQLRVIKKMDEEGVPICAVKGVENVLRDFGIRVRYTVYMDARPDQVRFIKKPSKDTTYIVASQCDPSLFDALDGNDIRVFHMTSPEHHEPGQMFILGGMTTGLRAINVMRTLGYDQIHAFGYDCSILPGASHVYSKARIGDVYRVYVGGVPFYTTSELALQHQQFLQMYVYTEGGPSIIVYGQSALYQSFKMLVNGITDPDALDMHVMPDDAPRGAKILKTAKDVAAFEDSQHRQLISV